MSTERRRRHHRKTRGACKSCVDRHIRCDQEKPFCRNCLKSGFECSHSHDHKNQDSEIALSYGTASTNFMPSPWRKESSHGFDRMLGRGMFDPLNSLPIELKHDSARMFDHFNNYRVLVRSLFKRPSGGELFEFVTSDPLLMHTAVLLAANHFHLLQQVQAIPVKALYYHKGEAIRMINSRLTTNETAMSAATLGAVSGLIILESNSGSHETALQHLNGLEALLNLCGGLHTRTINSLLHRMILLADLNATSATNTKPRFQNHRISNTSHSASKNIEPVSLNALVSRPSSTAAPNTLLSDVILPPKLLQKYSLDPSSTRMLQDLHRISKQLLQPTDHTTIDKASLAEEITTIERFIDCVLHNPMPLGTTVNLTKTNSMSFILAGYVYLYIFLRDIPLESPVYEWMVPMFREDLTRSGTSAREVFPPELLFWVLFLGGLVALNKSHSNWFLEQLRLVSGRLKLKTWGEARFCLESLVWLSHNEGIENKCESLWSEIMIRDQ